VDVKKEDNTAKNRKDVSKARKNKKNESKKDAKK
jgi:hypothetical protein